MKRDDNNIDSTHVQPYRLNFLSRIWAELFAKRMRTCFYIRLSFSTKIKFNDTDVFLKEIATN